MKSRKLLFISALIYGITGLLLLIFRYDFQEISLIRYDVFLLSGLTLVLLSFITFMYMYLQGYIKLPNRYDIISYEPTSDSDDIKDRIDFLEKKLSEQNFERSDINKEDLINDIKKGLGQNIIDEIQGKIEQTYSDEIIKNEINKSINNDFESIRKRILNEVNKLSKRANINLSIGSFITVIAVGILFSWVYYEQHDYNEMTAMLSVYIPRITTVLFIEVFSFFFLKLYKNDLENIKYYQNVLTSLESKYSALKSSAKFKDDGAKEYSLKKLANIEMNREPTSFTEEKNLTNDDANIIINLLKKIANSTNQPKV